MAPRLIIFTDLDGSLLDHYTYSFEAAVPLLKQLEQLHIPVVFTTSKTAAEVEYLRLETGNQHPFIVENGAGIHIPTDYFPGSNPELVSVHKWPFFPNSSLLSKFNPRNINYMPVVKFIERLDLEKNLSSMDRHELAQKDDFLLKSFVAPHKHWATLINKVDPKFRKHFKTFTMMSEVEIAQITGLSKEEARRAKQREFGEPVSWTGSESLKEDFIQELRNLGAHILLGGRFVHVSGNCNKGRALSWLLDQYRKEYQEECLSLAAGDSDNDIDMLETADFSILIRSPVHPPPSLQKSSHIYTSSLFGPHGWVEGIEHFLSKSLKTPV